MPTAQQVEVYNPQGVLGTIPESQLAKAKDAGYKPKSDFVEVVHPTTGQRGIVPKDQWGTKEKPGIAQTAGYVISPREQQREQAKAAKPITAPPPMTELQKGMAGPEMRKMEAANIEAGKFGAEMLAGGELFRALKAFTAPTRTTTQVASKILGPSGEPIMQEVEKMGESQAKRLLKFLLSKGVREAIGGVGVGGVTAYEVAKHMAEKPKR